MSRFFQMLIGKSLASHDIIKNMRQQIAQGWLLKDVCLQAGIVDWMTVFLDVYGYPYVDLREGVVQLPEGMSYREAIEENIVQYRLGEQKYLVRCIGASKKEMKDRGTSIEAMADKLLIRSRLRSLYLESQDEHLQRRVESDVDFDLNRQLSQHSIESLIAEILERALEVKASDIHLEMNQSFEIAYRQDDGLIKAWYFDKRLQHRILNRLKLLSGMDIGENMLPQDGRFTLQKHGDLIDVRSSVLGTRHGEKMVLRLLPRKLRFHELAQLGIQKSDEAVLKEIRTASHGLYIFSGPTNSGKTTLLYTLLEDLKKSPKSIYSIEDPVESVVEGVQQIQLNVLRGLDFSKALRGILRMDPDVLMIGELRDSESAEIAVRAAMTGHLVLTTLHTYDAQSVVSRLADLGVSRELIANSLKMACNQRLELKTCTHCDGLGLILDDYCRICHGKGHHGRTLALEIWQLDDEDRQAIRHGEDPLKLRHRAIEKGFRTLSINKRKDDHKILDSEMRGFNETIPLSGTE